LDDSLEVWDVLHSFVELLRYRGKTFPAISGAISGGDKFREIYLDPTKRK